MRVSSGMSFYNEAFEEIQKPDRCCSPQSGQESLTKKKRVLATFWPVSAGSTLSKSLLTTLENVSTQCHLSRTFTTIGKTEKTLIPLDEQGVHVAERKVWVREPCKTPIPVDEQGRCAVAQEMGERDQKTRHPSIWKCTPSANFQQKKKESSLLTSKPCLSQCAHYGEL